MVNKRGVKVSNFGKPKEKQRLSKPAVSKPVPSSPERPKTPEQALPPLRKGTDVVPTGIPGLDEVMGGGGVETGATREDIVGEDMHVQADDGW